ncbi:N-6 DNA methylase [Candidatus Symbiobacter mobilis]|nr:N-6 DNA methylase [Candidatus Symbiobacter mobilis]
MAQRPPYSPPASHCAAPKAHSVSSSAPTATGSPPAMSLKKSERYASLCNACEELHCGADALQFRDYLLVLLFLKFLSDASTAASQPSILVPPGCSFADVAKLPGSPDAGYQCNALISRLVAANPAIQGTLDSVPFHDKERLGYTKDVADRLGKMVSIFEALHFCGDPAAMRDDLNDAFEHLCRSFTNEPCKARVPLYTPIELSRLMVQLAGLDRATTPEQSVYDPACGIGTTLACAYDYTLRQTGYSLRLFGQELDPLTCAMARINLALHGGSQVRVGSGHTFANPLYCASPTQLESFDYILSHPSFVYKSWSGALHPSKDPFGRFELGIPPDKSGDFAFLLHALHSLKKSGKAVLLLPQDVLYRGAVEGSIRARIVRQGSIRCVVGLPANLFHGTSVPACLLVLNTEEGSHHSGILMIDASHGFVQDGCKNRLRDEDVQRIADTFHHRTEVLGYSRMVGSIELEANAFNLNLPRYIEAGTA